VPKKCDWCMWVFAIGCTLLSASSTVSSALPAIAIQSLFSAGLCSEHCPACVADIDDRATARGIAGTFCSGTGDISRCSFGNRGCRRLRQGSNRIHVNHNIFQYGLVENICILGW